MKKYTIFSLIIVFATLISCNDDCNNVDAPESPSVFVSILDNTTNNSVFTDSLYFSNETSVRDYLDADIPFTIISDSIMHIVVESELITNDTIFINLANSEDTTEAQIKLLYSTYIQEEECYSQYKTENVSVLDYENELVDDIFQIKVD